MLRLIRPFVFPVLLLAALEWYARTLGQGSDAIAPPSKALQAFGAALLSSGEFSVAQATAFTLTCAGLGLLLGLGFGVGLGDHRGRFA